MTFNSKVHTNEYKEGLIFLKDTDTDTDTGTDTDTETDTDTDTDTDRLN